MHHNFTYKLADHIDVSAKKSTEIESTPSKISHLKPIKEENASDLNEPAKAKPAPDKPLEFKSSQAQNEPFEIQLLNESLELDHEESNDVEAIVKNLMNSLIQKIENGNDLSFKCEETWEKVGFLV